MAKTIVLPLIGPHEDPDGASARAVPLARAMAERLQARIRLVSVLDLMTEEDASGEVRVLYPSDALPHDSRLLKVREEIDKRIADVQTYLDSVAVEFPEGRAEGVIRYGGAKDALLDEVERLDDPLIVMASHARYGVRRLVLGSVAFAVVSNATCPVIVVPVREGAGATTEVPVSLRHLLVPLDGSVVAECVLDRVLPWIGTDDAELHLVHVIDPLVVRTGMVARDYEAMAREEARVYLERVTERLTRQGYRVVWSIRSGDASREIAQAASDNPTDLIVMATNGRSGFRRAVLGSVAESVANATSLPLLLVRPTEAEIQQSKTLTSASVPTAAEATS
jgi:nucleotide-binding universal stress UspA family protein